MIHDISGDLFISKCVLAKQTTKKEKKSIKTSERKIRKSEKKRVRFFP